MRNEAYLTYAAMTNDEVQRSIRTFYEAVNTGVARHDRRHKTIPFHFSVRVLVNSGLTATTGGNSPLSKRP